MIYRVNMQERRWQLLYYALYEKVQAFLVETDNDPKLVDQWFMRLVGQDPGFFLLVELDAGFQPESHAVITIEAKGSELVAFVQQTQVRAKKDSTFVAEGMEFLRQLSLQEPRLTAIVHATSQERHHAFKRKYGFEVERVVMCKPIASLEPYVPLALVGDMAINGRHLPLE